MHSEGGDVVGSLFLLFFLNGTEFDTFSKSCIAEFQIWVIEGRGNQFMHPWAAGTNAGTDKRRVGFT